MAVNSAFRPRRTGADQFEDQVQEGWRSFRQQLADAVAERPFDVMVNLGAAFHQPDRDEVPRAPWAQVDADCHGLHVRVPTNRPLEDQWRLPRARLTELRRELGVRSDNTYYYEAVLPIEHADEAADVVMRYFRDFVGIPHPAFLSCPSLPTTVAHEPRVALWAQPTGQDQMQAMLRGLLGSLVGELPEADEDGEYCLITPHGPLFLSASFRHGMVRMWGPVMTGITDRTRALEHVNAVNASASVARFRVQEDEFLATGYVYCLPWSDDLVLGAIHRFGCDVDMFTEFTRTHPGRGIGPAPRDPED